MSTYDDSSLFLYPSGYKASVLFAQKPMDANGQLAFTRSNDTATRVAENGLIERVRTNLILQSNSFSTTWTASNASVTSGQAGYDGTNNAWLLSKSAAQGHISQSPASSGSETISVYAKAGTDNWLHILIRDTSSVFFGGYWDLQNGVVGSATGATTLKIESVGNGWYRCSASFAKSTSNYYRIYPAEGNNDTSGTSGNILIQASQLEAGDVATDYIPTTTAAVSVGPVANIPRIDYTGGGCGKLLLEPQRTNLALYSEQIDNAAWTKFQLSVTANNAISPDGYTNADLLDDGTAASTQHWFYQNTILANSTTYTLSLYAKYVSRQNMTINIFNGATSQYVDYNIQNGTILGSTGDVTASITSVGNGWYRLTYTRTMAATGSPNYRIGLADDTGSETYTGSNKQTLIYGCQIEAGSYPSSYVNTLAASVTRGADACSKTGISSLIGQSEGTLFAEFSLTNYNSVKSLYTVDVGATTNFIAITLNSGNPRLTVRQAGSSSVLLTPAQLPFGNYKLAVGYKSGDYVMYINGVQVGASSSTVYPVGALTGYILNNSSYGELADSVSQALLFKTRLPNSELASLTAL